MTLSTLDGAARQQPVQNYHAGDQPGGTPRQADDAWLNLTTLDPPMYVATVHGDLTRNAIRAIGAAALAQLRSAVANHDASLRGAWLPPQTFGLPGGGIQHEWHAGDNHLELSIEADGVVTLLADSSGSDCHDFELHLSRSPIPAVATRVLAEIIRRVVSAREHANEA